MSMSTINIRLSLLHLNAIREVLNFDASTDNMQRICYFYHVIQKVVITQDRTETILCRSSGNLFVSLNI